jgi:hypothetical protein
MQVSNGIGRASSGLTGTPPLKALGDREVPTTARPGSNVPHWLKPITAKQAVDEAISQLNSFFRDSPIDLACLKFHGVRGKVFSLPFWSSEFNGVTPSFPKHSVVVSREDLKTESARIGVGDRLLDAVLVLQEELEASKLQDPAEVLAGDPLTDIELAGVPEVDSAASVTPIFAPKMTSDLL